MRIGLWSDSKISLPLMKISAYHKKLGDDVEFLNHLNHYDKVYCSKVFSFTPDADDSAMIYADEIQKGGSGYHIFLENGKEIWEGNDQPLPDKIEHICPDYGLYSENESAIGFLTRGCPRNCGFCIVWKKDGYISTAVSDLEEWWICQKNINLMDANILACKDHERLLKQLIRSKAFVDFSQGLDARLVTKDNIKLINQVRTKMLHFAWDDAKTDLREKFDWLSENLSIQDPRKRTIYNPVQL